MNSIGNCRHMHEHRSVVECINRGIRTIQAIADDTGLPTTHVYRSVAYCKRMGLIRTAELSSGRRKCAVYAPQIPLAAALASLPVELPPPTFDALETAFGVPSAVLETIANQARPRRVELMGMSAE